MDLSRRQVLAASVAGVALKAENPIVGGTVLRRAAIQSPNFVTGVSGWQINQNGSAEFNNITIRNGTVVSGTALYYSSSPPALGTLIASVNATGGLDSVGNATVAGGFVSYNQASLIAVQLSSNTLAWYTAPSAAGPWTAVANLTFSGTGPNFPLVAGNVTTLLLTCNSLATLAAGASITGGELTLTDEAFPAGVAGRSKLLSNAGMLGQVNGSGLNGRSSMGRPAGVTPVVVTQAAFTSLFNDTILANDAAVGATYKASAFGFGAWGSTVQDLIFGIRFGATDATVIGTSPDINSASFAASALFRWEAEAVLTCVTTGATAHWVANIKGMVTQTANSILVGTAGTNSISFTGGTGSGTVTLDSTVNEIFGISAHWAATTGAPTLTAVSGIMERIA